jgi:ElaB/YqjD/DUF883 family membrane-anchored ribosome-binding protein
VDSQFQSIAEEIKKTFEQYGNSGEIGDLKKIASDAADETAQFVKKYPIQSVLGAAVIGFLLASYLKKKSS